MADLNTTDNAISVYLIEDEATYLDRLIPAYAATRHYLDVVDFALLEPERVPDLSLEAKAVLGETPDRLVNQWHHELVQLTGTKLVELGLAIREENRIRRYQEKRVERLVLGSMRAGNLDRARIKPTLLEKPDQLSSSTSA